ncbi:MAG TPA: hypothetical protein VNN80_26055 [Polyangiaceae bacterium]|nr:hypothetical protein [Polyangiaceae bacterium]
MAAALRGGPAPRLPEGSAAARAWGGLSALLESVPMAERGEIAALLQACWLEQALRLRPLTGPYFAREERLEFDAPRELHAGERFELSAPGIDVVRWQLQAWGKAQVIVREGDGVARLLSWSAPAVGDAVLSRPRSIRVVPPARGGRVSLEVLEGKVSFQQRAWMQRRELSELWAAPLHARLRSWDQAERSALPWVRAVASVRATRSAARERLTALAEAMPAGDLQAWLWLEAARAEPETEAALALTERSASVARAPLLQILALQHRRDRMPPTPPGALPRAWPATLRSPSDPAMARTETDLWLLALRGRDAVAPGARPRWAAQLESWAALRSEDYEVWASVAAYFRSIPYRSVPPSPGALITSEYLPLQPGTECLPASGAPDAAAADPFDRWLLPAPGRTPIEAVLPPQHYAPLLIKPLAPEPVPERRVSLDEHDIPLHAGAGLSSEVAVSTGAHVLEVPADAEPVAVRLSEGVHAPCELQRRMRSWVELDAGASADFELPGAGAVSIARVTLAPSASGSDINQELEVRIGARRLTVWGRGARSGAGEIRVEAADTRLTLEARGAAVRVRVELRRAHDAPERQPAARPAGNGAKPKPAARRAPERPEAGLEAALLALRELSRNLRVARGEALESLRVQRARLLEALGFEELAQRDAEPAPEPENEWRWLPAEEDSVLPLNLASKVAPLPLPGAAAGLAERRQRLRLAGCEGFGAETAPQREPGADAETLLIAHCAEQNGLALLAADNYAALGHAQPNGAALARAATLLADHALTANEPLFAMRARMLAGEAAALGTDTSDVLARLGPALQWVVPNAYERAAGFANVTLAAQPQPTLGTRVRRALVDAPEDALLLEGARPVQFPVRAQEGDTLQLDFGCDDPADLACQPALELDAVRLACLRGPASDGPCSVALGPGEHLVALRLPSEQSLGWLRASLSGNPLPVRLSSRWIDAEAEEPAQLTVRGPTLVVMEARGSGREKQSVTWNGCAGPGREQVFELPDGTDSGATRSGSEQDSVGPPLRVELPIETLGPCTLRLRPDHGRVLFRLSVARAVGLPRARLSTAPAPEPELTFAPAAVPAVPLTAYEPAPEVPLDRSLPLLVLGRSQAVFNTRSVDEELAPQRTSLSHLELSVLGARELVAQRLWSSLSAGSRFRDGPPSWFGQWGLDLPANGPFPGLKLDAASYVQEIDGRTLASLRASGALSLMFRLAPSLSLVPRATYAVFREPARPSDLSLTDGDVYSAYRAAHPHYLGVDAQLNWRPVVDALSRFRLSARALPGLDGVDRVGAAWDWLIMPLHERNILIELGTSTSYRPGGPERSRAYTKQMLVAEASYWSWLSRSERLRVFGRVDGSVDLPTITHDQVVLSALVGLELSSSGERGLRDLPPASVPFLDAQERGRPGPRRDSDEDARGVP